MKVKMDGSDAAVAVVIGRFQVPELHEAHKDLIDSVKARHPRVVIVLGMSPVPGSRSDPLDFASRKQMIQEVYPDVDVLYIKDCKSDELWSIKLDEIVNDLKGPNHTAVLYGSRDSFVKSYHGRFPTLELEATVQISGTEIRDRMSKKAHPSFDWRAGAIWQAYNQFPKVWATVDGAILDGPRGLFGRKPGENLFRFVGGFSDGYSDSYEADVIREIKEETCLDVVNTRYIGSFKIDDWRYRGKVDCIKTLFFVTDYVDGQPKAADDLEEVKWFDVNGMKDEEIVEGHRVLLNALKTFMGKGVK